MHERSKRDLIPYWWRLVAIFFLGWVAIYAGRLVLSPVMPHIEQEWGLGKSQLGLIMSLFFLAYTALQIPSGILGDIIGRKNILVPGFILFAAAIATVSLSSSFTTFIMLWMIVGAAQGVYYGPQFALSSEAIPPKWVALGSAIINCGMAFGISFGLFLSSLMTEKWGFSWKAPFWGVAIPVLVVAVLMALFIREHASPLDAETKAQQAAAKSGFSFRDLFKKRNLVLAYVTIFCSIYGFFVIITWLPYYLNKVRGMTMVEASGYTSIVPWVAITGSVLCSYISDRIGRRKPVVLCMMPLSLLAIFGIVYSQSTTVLIAVLVLYGLIGKLALNPVLVALVADNAPKAALSTAFGLYNFFGMASSILSPYVTGWLAERPGGSLNDGFYFAAAVTLAGIIAMLFVKEKPEQLEA
ncbi:MAG: Major facilitator family transporter [Candidatus Tokpelaia hoelldobleri]|uniref:Major facilitator family transporter n=1 Tax=Candidatus Tokpelaia hoelldobleri TaxID=1902579 RepID=A0A1U9JV26_9HYPH|nr:MAG: Major facilitator family transporter [Candidatus Tokpelaia hoelldoblerii]